MGPLTLTNLQAADFLQGPNCGYVANDHPFVELPYSLMYVSPLVQPGDIFLHEKQPTGFLGPVIVCGIMVIFSPTDLYVRFQWPNGRFSSNQRMPSAVMFQPLKTFNPSLPNNEKTNFTFNGPALPRPARGEPIVCPVGTDIGIELENKGTGPTMCMIEFRGRLRRFLAK